MNKYIQHILEWFIFSNNKTVFESIENSIKIGFMFSPFVYLWNHLTSWVLTNEAYITIVFVTIFVDYIFGTIKHIFFTKTFQWKDNIGGLFIKTALVIAGVFLFEAFNHLTLDIPFIVEYLQIVTHVLVFAYPAISAWENMYIVSGNKFPPSSWILKFKKFQETAELKSFKKKEKKEDE